MEAEDVRLRLQRLYKLTADEANTLIQSALDSRKKERLLQVRAQSKKIAARVNHKVKSKERNALKELSNTLEEEWKARQVDIYHSKLFTKLFISDRGWKKQKPNSKKLFAFAVKRSASPRRKTTPLVIPRLSMIFKRSGSTMLIVDTKSLSRNFVKNESALLKRIKSVRRQKIMRLKKNGFERQLWQRLARRKA